jgi:hypothetical protein
VTVVINGGRFFPWVTQAYRIRYFPGISIYQALVSTGNVRFGFNGRIVAVNGVIIADGIDTILRLNGRFIPESLIYLPLQIRDTVSLDIILIGRETVIPRNEADDANAFLQEHVVNNYDLLQQQPEEDNGQN